MASQWLCPSGTIYDPDDKVCNRPVDIAAAQQAIADASKRGAGSATTRTLQMGKESFQSNPLVPPWVQMPDGGYPFSPVGTINTPAIGAGFTDVIGPNAIQLDGSLFPFQIPNGNDGVIRRLVTFYNGGGFISGSGQLIWRILINGQAVRNYEKILVQLGVAPFPGEIEGIRIRTQDTVQFQVSNIGVIGAGTQISCLFNGWFYPSKLS